MRHRTRMVSEHNQPPVLVCCFDTNGIKFLYRKSQFLDTNTRKLLASALVQCHYDYACSFWYSGLTKRTKSKLQISQNKLIRFKLNLQPRKHLSSKQFKSLGWLPIEQRVEQLKLNHVYRVLGGTASTYLSGRLTLNNHSHNTRSSQSFLIMELMVKVLSVSLGLNYGIVSLQALRIVHL